MYLRVVENLKFFRLAFVLANCWITFLKWKFLGRSFSIKSKAKPLSLSWDMELRKKFLISLSLIKDLSAVATVTGTVMYIMHGVQRQNKLWQVMHFQQSKKAISLVDFKWAIFSLNDVLMKSIWLGNNGEAL